MTVHDLKQQLAELPDDAVVCGGLEEELFDRVVHFVDKSNPNFPVIIIGSQLGEKK